MHVILYPTAEPRDRNIMHMQSEHQLNTFDLIILAVTRGMLGAGIGLLVAGRLSDEQRRAVGRTLVAVGTVTTVPLAFRIFGARSNRHFPVDDARRGFKPQIVE